MRTCIKLIAAGLMILISNNIVLGMIIPSVEEEREYVRKGQKEWEIKRVLSGKLISWLSDANNVAGKECDRLVDSLLTLPEPSIEAYFIAAQVAWLREKPKKAIAILEDAIRKYPDERDLIPSPTRIVGRVWIGTIARYSGDMAKAKKIYETLLTMLESKEKIQGLEDREGRDTLIMMCNLYLAEIESLHLKRNDLALSRLEAIERIKKPAGQLVLGYDIYQGWAQYQHTIISKGKAQATQQLIMYPEMASGLIRAAECQLMFCGISVSLLAYYQFSDKKDVIERALFDRVIKSSVSPFERSLARLIYGSAYQEKGHFAEAEKYYSVLFDDDSFFSPVAGLYLAQIKKAQGKAEEANSTLEQVRTKYPGYESAVTELRESWKKEGESKK